MSLICTPTALCDAHRDGASKRAKCPGLCDRRGCRKPIDTRVVGAEFCDLHKTPRKPGPAPTTGSKATPIVSFRLAAETRRRAEAWSVRDKLPINKLAERAFLAALPPE